MADGNSQIVLEVTQVWRGKDSEGEDHPLHWALTFKTAGKDDQQIGNRYTVAGNTDTYCYEVVKDVPLRDETWRGSLSVGRIPAEAIPRFERLLAQIPVTRYDPSWNSQNWVWASLRELRNAGFSIEPILSWSRLRSDMYDLLEAWERGDI
ncbi:hypothetical protein BV20DRAFT_968288 [Pilatotrama ljubarskyi]|nr:hypothetical protein BV20DRAFT_968288 [Pilatotrama ljubarskyi]